MIASYEHSGLDAMVDTDYPQPDVFMHRSGASSGSYPALDRFNRVTASTWTKDLTAVSGCA